GRGALGVRPRRPSGARTGAAVARQSRRRAGARNVHVAERPSDGAAPATPRPGVGHRGRAAPHHGGTMRRGTILVPVAALVVALGCDEDDVVGDGTVIGRVDATTQPFAATVPVASAARAPFRFAARGVVALPRDATARLDAAGPVALRQVGPGTAAATVALGRFARDGDLRVFVLGDVGADARFRVTGVPAGLTRLIAEVRDEAGAAIGRSIIHIGPGVGEVVPVAAIDGETTAEANVL